MVRLFYLCSGSWSRSRSVILCSSCERQCASSADSLLGNDRHLLPIPPAWGDGLRSHRRQDRRKATLVMTLILMGAATALIGVLPTYTQVGVWAPISLITLRILQGFSAGGEWGGAALMAVEHAPVDKRSFFGSFPQLGVPLGMILATLVLLVLTAILTKDQFTAWGWRLPFLFSVALVFTGFLIRRTVEESPVYEQMHRRRKESSAPLGEL